MTNWNTMLTRNTASNFFEYVHSLVYQSVGSSQAPITIGYMGLDLSYLAFDLILYVLTH